MRILLSLPLVALIAWGVALQAWLATAATAGLVGVVWWPAARRRGWLAASLIALILTAGTVEVLGRITAIGARARASELGLQDKLAVYGFNLVWGTAAIAAGLPEFGWATLAMAVPISPDGVCEPGTREAYGAQVSVRPTPLRRWSSSTPMRDPTVRATVLQYAESLPPVAAHEARIALPTRKLGPWPWTAYVDPSASSRVVTALNTSHTRLHGEAVPVGGRWRLDLSVTLPMAYPEASTMRIGPFELEEGMFHDAAPLLTPYCLEYTWSVWADDPSLHHEGPVRGPLETLSTGLLRALGMRY